MCESELVSMFACVRVRVCSVHVCLLSRRGSTKFAVLAERERKSHIVCVCVCVSGMCVY